MVNVLTFRYCWCLHDSGKRNGVTLHSWLWWWKMRQTSTQISNDNQRIFESIYICYCPLSLHRIYGIPIIRLIQYFPRISTIKYPVSFDVCVITVFFLTFFLESNQGWIEKFDLSSNRHNSIPLLNDLLKT